MINLPSHRLPALVRWFPTGAPGSGALTEHVLITEAGRWWVDRVIQRRAIAVECGDHVLLRGEPGALTPGELAAFADHSVEGPGRFLPLIGAAFQRVVPWQRVVYVKRSPVPAAGPPRGVTVRRMNARDTPALTTLPPATSWIHRTWAVPMPSPAPAEPGPHCKATASWPWPAPTSSAPLTRTSPASPCPTPARNAWRSTA